jgi:hypothetical protein
LLYISWLHLHLVDKGSAAGNDAPYPSAALVEPSLNLQSSHHLCEIWATLCSEPKPQKGDGWSEAPQLNLLIP